MRRKKWDAIEALKAIYEEDGYNDLLLVVSVIKMLREENQGLRYIARELMVIIRPIKNQIDDINDLEKKLQSIERS